MLRPYIVTGAPERCASAISPATRSPISRVPSAGAPPGAGRGLAPERGDLGPVGLAARGGVPPRLPRRLEGHPRDALDLGRRVAQRVDGGGSAVLPAARLAVVQAARELPHDEYVHALEAIGLER